MKVLVLLALILLISACSNPSDQKNTTQPPNTVEQPKSEPAQDTAQPVQPDTVVTSSSPVKTDPSNKEEADFTYQSATSKSESSFQELYKEWEQPVQQFTIPAGKQQTIKGKRGTRLTIDTRSFTTKSGNEINGPLEISLREYYAPAEMLLANLTTASGITMLETGGMIYVEATSNGEECVIKPGASMGVSFPTEKIQNGMQLFTGSWKGNQVDWKPVPDMSAEVVEPSVYQEADVDILPQYPGGDHGLNSYLLYKTYYPKRALEQEIQGTVFIEFVVNEQGDVEDAQVMRSVDSSLDQEALDAINGMPKWIPGKRQGKNVSVRTVVPVKFELRPAFARTEVDTFAPGGLDWRFRRKKSANEEKLDRAIQYAFTTSELGWINCDRFYNTDSPRTDFVVEVDRSYPVDVKVVFRNINSIMPGYPQNDGYQFNKLPVGERVTVLGIKREDSRYRLAMKEARITKAGMSFTDQDFKPVTVAELRDAMQQLN